jgi:hypothetical protein
MPAPQFGHLSLEAATSGAVNSVVSWSGGDVVDSRRASISIVENESTAAVQSIPPPARTLVKNL